MSFPLPYIQVRRSGRLEYRRAFPQRLWPILRRREHIVSLKAKSLSEPGATERYHAANDNFVRLVANADKVASGAFDQLDAPRLAWVLATYEADFLAADAEARLRGKLDPEAHDAADSGWTDIFERGDRAFIKAMFEDDLVAISQRQGWVFDANDEAFATACMEMLRTLIQANRLRMERDEGHRVPTPAPPEPPVPSNPTHSSAHQPEDLSFDAVVREEMRRPTFTGGASTKQSWNTALRYLGEVHGKLAPHQLSRRHASDLIDMLAQAPIKRVVKPSERDWPLPMLVERYTEREVERLSWKARGTILGALQAAWNQCQRSGRISDHLPNPFARPNLGKAPSARRNDGLTRDEARKIFSLGVFTAGDRPSGGRGEARFWLPILLLTTGARPEELAQTLVGDVRRDAEANEWAVAITAQGAHPHKGERALKTPSAERIIPLPHIVVDLGFGDYVDWLANHEELALFPALRTKGERGELWPSFGGWWASYLGENEARPNGKRPAREFRPTWATIARECGVGREAQEYLMGHAPDANDMNARYGSREPLRREMHKLRFDGWGLEQLRAWTPPTE